MGKNEEALAEDPSTAPDVLDELARKHGDGVKQRVAANPNTRPETLQYLAENTHWFIIIYSILESNPKTPESVFLRLALSSTYSEDIRLLGLRKLPKERIPTVIGEYRENIKWKFDAVMSWGLLGEALRRIGDFPGAMDACKRALAVVKSFGLSHFVMACILVEKGDDKEGLKHLQQAFKYSELYKLIALRDPTFDRLRETPALKKAFKGLAELSMADLVMRIIKKQILANLFLGFVRHLV
jgi:tetratricopeptide (TPR) repeat protein